MVLLAQAVNVAQNTNSHNFCFIFFHPEIVFVSQLYTLVYATAKPPA
jgi:hypothetical protein